MNASQFSSRVSPSSFGAPKTPAKSLGNTWGRSCALCLLLFVFPLAHASDVITGTLTITNAAAITPGTNSAAITINADTRVITNAVSAAATEILLNTTNALLAQRILVHASTYPFSGLQLGYPTSTSITFRTAAGGSLAITLSGTNWGKVDYATNAVGTATIVRVPYSIESPAQQTNVANGLAAWLNLAANTTGISASKLTGNLPAVSSSALAVDSAATNFVANFTSDVYQTITATNDVFFVQSTNRPASGVLSKVFLVYPNGTNRNLGVNASWHAISVVDAVLTNTTIGVLSLTGLGSSETNVFYSFKAVP